MNGICTLYSFLLTLCKLQIPKNYGRFKKILEILETLEEMLDVSVIPILDMTLNQWHNEHKSGRLTFLGRC